MKTDKSLWNNSNKKRKILICCAIAGTGIIMAGAGVGISCAFKNIPQPLIATSKMVVNRTTDDNIIPESKLKINGTHLSGFIDTYDQDWGTKLVIPSSITDVDNCAFYECSGLTSVVSPAAASVSIGVMAFAYCAGLQFVDLGSFSTIGNYAFWDCTSLTAVISTADTLKLHAFEGCTNLQSISTGALTTIDDGVFGDCYSLQSFDFKEVLAIGNYAFQNCASLTSVTTKATTIGAGAFANCTSLTSAITEATTIAEDAFNNCTNLQSVSTGTLTNIMYGAFDGCTSLNVASLMNDLIVDPAIYTKTQFPATGTPVGIMITNAPYTYKAGYVVGCLAVGDIAVAGEEIKSSFQGCASLTSIDIGEAYVIHASVFAGCTNLTSIIEKNVALIEAGAFDGCSTQGNVSIPDGATPWNLDPRLTQNLGSLMTWTYTSRS